MGKKRKADDDIKKEKTEDEERKIREALEEKHKDKYTIPQYTLWAKFIRMGRHSCYVEPPKIPFWQENKTGIPLAKKTYSCWCCYAQAIKPTEKSPCKAPVQQLSPYNKATLRRRYLEDCLMNCLMMEFSQLMSFKSRKTLSWLVYVVLNNLLVFLLQ